MRPNSSSCLPSAHWRSSSVSLAHFCFSLPLVMFQSPLTSSLFILYFVLFLVCIRRQHDGKSVLATRVLARPVKPPPAWPQGRRPGLWSRGEACGLRPL